ncbi:MAG: S1/P1 nuclease [Flavitalea sp.]
MKQNLPFGRLMLAIIILANLPFNLFAWGVTGHRVVGEIASSHLSSRARKEIQKILGDESLAMAANWGDFIKSDSTYDYIYNWHYLNIDKNYSYDDLVAFLKTDSSSNVYTRVNMLSDSLRKGTMPEEKKVMYLRLLIHFVGDLHQPLHIGRAADQGGNTLKLQWFGASSNMHTIWDTKLVDFQQLSYTEYANYLNHPSKADKQKWQKAPISEWIFESYKYAGVIYSEYKGEDQRLSYDYNFRHIAALNNQLLKGGVRLAGLLNDIFG